MRGLSRQWDDIELGGLAEWLSQFCESDDLKEDVMQKALEA
jgi:hypothetical protein